MRAQQPEAGRPERMRSDQRQEELVSGRSNRVLLAEVLAIALIVLLVLVVCVLDPDLVRRWSSSPEAWRLFGGPTPSN